MEFPGTFRISQTAEEFVARVAQAKAEGRAGAFRECAARLHASADDAYSYFVSVAAWCDQQAHQAEAQQEPKP